ncbi:MAG: porphobilinogen synthase [Candidatus Omnitrophica bacterium]|nr:porphobilinogen synthase [Candidatus Omnitrophota bacterium]
MTLIKSKGWPATRLRRLRATPQLRALVRESNFTAAQLILPCFVKEAAKKPEPISSMPGVVRHSLKSLAEEAKQAEKLGIGAILLFGIPSKKDAHGSQADEESGVVQEAVRTVKRAAPKLAVITDVCLCEYTNHGHCGILTSGKQRVLPLSPPTPTVLADAARSGKASGCGKRMPHHGPLAFGSRHPLTSYVDNDSTLKRLAAVALSHAKAGADMVAPSAMMDGQVRIIRRMLDENGYESLPILAYAAKYSSAFYGPFRGAVGSAPQFGDRAAYQMDPHNVDEALREVALDIEEGADIVMVKPGYAYLDVVRVIKERFHWPLAIYQVSGEYAMVKAAAARGWLDGDRAFKELVASARRAGADLVITYEAVSLAKQL